MSKVEENLIAHFHEFPLLKLYHGYSERSPSLTSVNNLGTADGRPSKKKQGAKEARAADAGRKEG